MMELCKKFWHYLLGHKHFFLLLYACLYVPWFIYVENKVSVDSNFHIIHMAIDDKIPFCEYFIVPYYLWFVFMGAVILYVAFTDGRLCWQLGLFLITGMTVFLIVSTVYPNGDQLRPDTFARDNIFVTLVQKLYATDTPTNLFPSIHVYNSMGCLFAILKGKRFDGKNGIKTGAVILTILIILSTLFLKQHSMFDVLTGLALAVVMYIISYGSVFDRIVAPFEQKKIAAGHVNRI